MPTEKTAEKNVTKLDELFVLDHAKLREVAFAVKRMDRSATLNVTALVNQTYLRLREGTPDILSALHLRRIAGQAMRHILADAARARAAQKRGGDGSIQFVTVDASTEHLVSNDKELLALDDALDRLATLNWRQKEIVECHFFGGMNWREVADYMDLSLATVEREWRGVRGWLREQLSRNC